MLRVLGPSKNGVGAVRYLGPITLRAVLLRVLVPYRRHLRRMRGWFALNIALLGMLANPRLAEKLLRKAFQRRSARKFKLFLI